MLHDPTFAARIHSGDREAARSAELGDTEVRALARLDPAALAADRDGKRSDTLLRNVASELSLTFAADRSGWERGFLRSPEFHHAIHRDASLPLALAAYAGRCVRGTRLQHAILRLEIALLRARRRPAAPSPVAGASGPPSCAGSGGAGSGGAERGRAFALSTDAEVIELPRGTFTYAAALRESVAAATPAPPPPRRQSGREAILVHARGVRSAEGLREAHAEPLPDAVADFVRRAAHAPLDLAARHAFAQAHDVPLEEVEAVAADLVADGIFVTAP
jgi:hypothetical protein